VRRRGIGMVALVLGLSLGIGAMLVGLVALVDCSRRSVVVEAEARDAATPLDAGAEADAQDPGVDAAPGPVAPPGPMVLLKGGRFKMGSDWKGWGGSSRMVRLPRFRLDVTKVTVAQYRGCVRAGACSPPEGVAIWDPAGVPEVPISGVTWYQADAYCKWAGKELPTEEQWEFACAGAGGRDFPWGQGIPNHPWGAPDDLDERINRSCKTCAVGVHPKGATPDGIQDMMGLASEWTASIECPDPLPPGPFDAHRDPKTCTHIYRAIRGGDVGDEEEASHCVVGGRSSELPSYRAIDHVGSYPAPLGFRCAQRVEETKNPDEKR
jgi:formylglycine-generating enzyme required for sulfatase activity